jgi:hypothetical protein
VAKRTYEAAVELFAFLCEKYGLDPTEDGVVISHSEGYARGVASNHGDSVHLWKGLGLSYTMDEFRKDVQAAIDESSVSGVQATEFKNLTEAQVIAKVGALFTADQKKNGILASVSLAQFILESGYGKSELAQNANNCFGMKKSLSGNTWSGSSWDGTSVYTKQTKEQNDMCVRHMSEEDLQKEYEFLAAEKLIGKMRNFGLINETESQKFINECRKQYTPLLAEIME